VNTRVAKAQAPARRSNKDAGQATERVVIDAAVACILERGFYRASSNEIARRAGVTWGVIQHYFGTREALMLAVLEDGARRLTEVLTDARIAADSVAERLEQLIEVLALHYGDPTYLAYVQVALNMDHDPATSAEVRSTMREVAARSTADLRRLVREAVGPATAVPDLGTTMFLVLRGFVVSQQLVETMAYDAVVPTTDRVQRQRRLLAQALAPFVELASRESTTND
jgi:AcrR family transcriptional regulator